MRLLRLSTVALLAVFLLPLLAYSTNAAAKPSPKPRTYTVFVGAENAHRGIDVMAYFPDSVKIHVGDTVKWTQNSNEIHTVTFLSDPSLPALIVPAIDLGLPADPSPLVFNPVAVTRDAPSGGLADTTAFVNSGLMGRETGQYRSFTLTFTAEGTYHYLCLVHGAMMSGTVTVVGTHKRVASPGQVSALGHHQIARQMAKAPAVVRAAERQIKPATTNPDGTLTHYVWMGYSHGQIDLMRFFPSKLRVRPGDTVVWEMSPSNDAPHTVTFLNGQPEPGLVVPVTQPSGPPVLYINPAVLFPSPLPPASVLTRSGRYNSGLMNPGTDATSWQVSRDVAPGPLPYLCLLHDTSGMRGTLTVLPH
jgi:plastocyanin